MKDEYGLGYRLRLLDMVEPWRSPIGWMHEVAYENLKDINLRVVLLCLRDMAFRPPQAGHTAFDCLNEWCGTSVGKHFAIHNLLQRIGLAPRLWMANYSMVPCLPITDEVLVKVARKHQVQDVHVFLTCDFGMGERVLDMTYPARLADQGFIVTPDWKRSTDCPLPCAPHDRHQITPDARGLCQIRMWLQRLNPGIRMRYHQQVAEHIIRLAARDDSEEVRKRYIQRSYLRLQH